MSAGKDTSSAPRLRRAARALATAAVSSPRAVLALAVVLAALALAAAAWRLETRTSNLDLIDGDLPPVAAFRSFAREFGSPNLLVVVLEGRSPDALMAAVDRLGPRLRAAPGVAAVFDRLPLRPELAAFGGVDPYFRSYDRALFFLFVQPDDPTSSASTLTPFVEGVRAALARERLEREGIEAGLTGTPAYALDDRDVIQRDLTKLSAFSLLALLALFVLGFESFRRPLFATATMLLSIALAFGAAVLYPGHLTLLSAFFASILFGQGIDSGIHLIAKVEELVGGGLGEREAVPEAVAALAPGLVTSTLTTSSALMALMASGFRGFAELGFVAAVSLVLCLVCMITVLPALLALFDRPRHRPLAGDPMLGRLLHAVQGRASLFALATFTAVAVWQGGPGYDTDYLNLQPRRSETVRLEREMVARSRYSPQFAVLRAGSRNEAAALVDKLRAEPTVGDVRSALDLEPLAALSGVSAAELARGLPRMISDAGGWAVFAYPKDDVWAPGPQRAFAEAMLAIDPRATGLPVLGRYMVERSLRAFRIAAGLGGLLIALLVYLDFRDGRWTALALVPTALTTLALPFLMRLCGLAFNPLDVMALPIVLGVSVDEGVHLVHRFRDERGDLRRTLAGAGRSILLTASTTLIGFGFLVFTEHRGLASFAAAVTLGVAAALGYALLLLPPILSWAGKRLLAADVREVHP